MQTQRHRQRASDTDTDADTDADTDTDIDTHMHKHADTPHTSRTTHTHACTRTHTHTRLTNNHELFARLGLWPVIPFMRMSVALHSIGIGARRHQNRRHSKQNSKHEPCEHLRESAQPRAPSALRTLSRWHISSAECVASRVCARDVSLQSRACCSCILGCCSCIHQDGAMMAVGTRNTGTAAHLRTPFAPSDAAQRL